MKKILWIFIFFIIILTVIFFVTKNNKKDDEYIAERTSVDSESEIKDNINENLESQYDNKEQLAEFSTKLPKDTKARESNIKLACNTLNGTIIEAGNEFSFWKVIGNPTKEKGYKKAKTFTTDGKIRKAYGGGLCQVSTTIYNAVIKVNGLQVTERHEHSRDVSYIEDGKDASVSYNNADLKFKNNLDYNIKIMAKLENNKVVIQIFRI